MPHWFSSSGAASSDPTVSSTWPSSAPPTVSSMPSCTSRNSRSSGRAPTARRMASSRCRCSRLASSAVTRLHRLSTRTSADSACSVRVTMSSSRQSWFSATAGNTASSASSSSALMSRCRLKTPARDFSPTRAAVMNSGFRSKAFTLSAGMLMPGMGAPACQFRWMAVMASRLMCSVRSTGVPVGARMPLTWNGLSACSMPGASPVPWVSVSRSPSL